MTELFCSSLFTVSFVLLVTGVGFTAMPEATLESLEHKFTVNLQSQPMCGYKESLAGPGDHESFRM